MKIFEAHISYLVENFFKQIIKETATLVEVNNILQITSGINKFFDSEAELTELKEKIFIDYNLVEEPDRTEYGDFQTNSELGFKITQYLSKQIKAPEILIEPTCGKGNFIIAALKSFSTLKNIYGIEIYKPYVWETKFSILNYFLQNSNANKPDIKIRHYNIFDFDFTQIASKSSDKNILIIGNPPWVTNSMLGSLNSSNLPSKSNFKKHSGLDAMTGKGNFDIAEYITLMMLNSFQNLNGTLVFLVKNSVIKNLVFDQKKNNYKIDKLEKHCIDSKKEFNVSVDAAMLFCELNSNPSFECKEFDFYNNKKPNQSFGWIEDKFVSNIETYVHSKNIDGQCAFEWRQGLKHDCSSIMEFDKVNCFYVNALNENAELEEDLIYGILKSSDLKNTVITNPRKYTIVTQKKVGQETFYIKNNFPKTYQYLLNHQNSFDTRKSSIYKDKPLFSIFGIGDYSFKPYKVVISGLYKTFHFSLVLPQNNKPIMLDDTCYMLGFDNIDFAVYTFILLNLEITKRLLQSITFSDAKRTFTKDVLMRMDIQKLSKQISLNELEIEIKKLNAKHNLKADLSSWANYIKQITPIRIEQIKMFA
ncbi:MAG: hypothetical protein ACR2FN_06240 [Chitinophagaceae bacterium]